MPRLLSRRLSFSGCADASSGSPGGRGPSPVIAHRGIAQTFELAHGRVVIRPPATRFPRAVNAATRAYHYTLSDGLTAVESADPLLWQNTGLVHTKATWLTAKAAYARVTVARDLRPKGGLGQNTLAFVVFYRIGLASGCVTGWRLYIEPLLAPSQNSGYVGPRYIVTTATKSGCGGQTHTASLVALPHWSQRWQQIGHSTGTSRIEFRNECGTVTRVVKVRRRNEERIQVILALGDSSCPDTEPRTMTFATPPGVHLVQGPTGVMPARHLPLR